MPIPTPAQDESKDDFISRCMGDEKMREEYPDEKQRAAVCHAQLKRDDTFTIEFEMLAPGLWNGILFRRRDLESIARNFDRLKDVHKVPLKLGHNDQQPLTDGMPALGWIEKIWVAQDEKGIPKLMGRAVDVPKVVYDAIKRKLYRKVSVELDIDVEHMGRHYDKVLSGVALLGADLPAVSTLNDLDHYLSRGFEGSRRVNFSLSLAQLKTGGATVDPEKLQEELNQIKLQREQEKAQFEREREELKRKLEEFERRDKERAEAEKKARIEAARKDVTELLDKAVEDMRITPAQRDNLSKLLKVDSDEVESVDLSVVKGLIEENEDKTKMSKDKTHTSGGGELPDDPGEALHQKVMEFRAQAQRDIPYDQALEIVMSRERELAAAHINATYQEVNDG